jgi:hypothetical protein
MKMEEGDEAYNMKKASEIVKGLRDLDLSEEDVQRIVKGKIESGEAHDDLAETSLNVDDLDLAIKGMVAAVAGEFTPEDDGDDLVNKGGDDLVDAIDAAADFGEAFHAIADADVLVAKGLNQLGRENRATAEVLTKGVLAVAKMVRDTAVAFKAHGEHLAQIQARQDQIAKAMGQPIPPRSFITGAKPIPAPYEGAVAKGGVEPDGQGVTDGGVTAYDVMKSARAELDDITKGGTTLDFNQSQRLKELSSAISRCESGNIDPIAIAGECNIKVA